METVLIDNSVISVENEEGHAEVDASAELTPVDPPESSETLIPTDTEEAPLIGTESHPIQIVFVPSVDVEFMITSGDAIERSLYELTGLQFDVSVPTSYAATIEEMCASPEDTIGFLPAMGYALANELCNVQPALASERYGWNVYWTAFFVARDSPYQRLEDLDGVSWAYPHHTSTSAYSYPKAILMT